ncbi:pyridoxine/pyridoxamine 5'-phosphate oxidase [Streptomyces sulphureus]|uniref:pyridoxine/pyridoxamine 5'-phosphate oxidase n=1 Tax=Streptomyces sulphureus TaxID=47758 RepID=UPI00037FB191|nr:pyridoxal 5'-phosphate synthase [Streptomyces sulphureus]
MTGLRDVLRALPVFEGELPSFDASSAPASPLELFTEWLHAAVDAGVPEPHAMTLATADAEGRPSSRVLILKDADEEGWQFATSARSPKGRELDGRPFAALSFHWPRLARQVRLRGPVASAGAERSAADFRARGADARAEALLGRQSHALISEAERRAALAEARSRLAAGPDLVAPDWTLYALRPETVEFWQGDRERHHTRLLYRRNTGGSWERGLLWA